MVWNKRSDAHYGDRHGKSVPRGRHNIDRSRVRNSTGYLDSKLRNKPEQLDEDMTAGDVVDVLKRLKFEDQFRLIEIDAAMRDFLVSAVTAMRRK